MLPPRIPENESDRILALVNANILDTPAEERFDRLTLLAKQIFKTSIVLVSLVDSDRQWFKSRQGLDACETGRDISFCGHAILQNEIFHIPDASKDPRFSDNPLVTGPPDIRFYAGAPLSIGEDTRVGTLCIIDQSPRTLSLEELLILRNLADCVERELNQIELNQKKVALRYSENERGRVANLLTNIMQSASDFSIIATDKDGLITAFNKGAEKLLGYSADEMVQKQSPALIHLPEEVIARGEELSAEYTLPISGFKVFVHKPEQEGSESRQWTYVSKKGKHIPINLVVTPMRNQKNEVTGYLGIAQDISQQLLAKQALKDQAQHTQAILDNVLDGIITISDKGLIDSMNPAAENIFGYSLEETIGQNVKMLMPRPHRENHDLYLQNYQAGGAPKVIGFNREVEGQRKNGSLFPMELAVSKVTRQNQTMYVGLVRDISERKHMERMKSEFVSTVSHELRTPLTSITGALGLITGGVLGELPDQIKEMLIIAENNSNRLTFLINDLLDMEKLAAGKMVFDIKQHNLLSLVEQSIEDNQGYGIDRKVSISLQKNNIDVNVNVDSQRFMQVMSNLLSNAMKYSPENDVVKVDVTKTNSQVSVTVSDNGQGIPKEFRPRIFQKFAQADSSDTRKKGGTGLGLAITRGLVERMGGSIGFDSIEGQGSQFYIRFQIGERATTTSETRSLLESVNLVSGVRILVIEDEHDVAHIISSMLIDAGYLVDTVYSGEDGLKAVEQQNYAAITIDLQLPGMTGEEVIQEIRRKPQSSQTPILIISASIERGKLSINNNYIAIECMAKPFSQKQLINIICNLTLKQKHITSRILHVEDDVDLHHVIKSMIGKDYHVENATSLREARSKLSQESFDLILLDIYLPDGTGWELMAELKKIRPTPRVIILSSNETTPEQAGEVEQTLLKSQVTATALLKALKCNL